MMRRVGREIEALVKEMGPRRKTHTIPRRRVCSFSAQIEFGRARGTHTKNEEAAVRPPQHVITAGIYYLCI